MRRRTALCLVFAVALVAPSFASGIEKPFGVDVSTTAVSRYIWRGMDVLSDDKPALQGDLCFSHNPTGMFFDIWGSAAVTDRDVYGDYDEVDFTAGWDGSLSPSVGISAGLIVYTVPKIDDSRTEEFYVGVGLTTAPTSPTVTAYYDFDKAEGLYLGLTGGYDYSFNPGATVNWNYWVGYNAGQWDMDPALREVGTSVGVQWSVGNAYFGPSFSYTYVADDQVNDDSGEYVFSFTLGHSW